jgi:NADH:ubiquinone oxidoreductase subunit K
MLFPLSVIITAIVCLIFSFVSYLRTLMLLELIITANGLFFINTSSITLGASGMLSALIILTLASTEAVVGLSLSASKMP